MNNKFKFSKWGFNYNLMSDILSVKSKTAFTNILLRCKMIAGGQVSRNFITICLGIASQLKSIQVAQGNRGLILYLKAAQISLQQSASRYRVKDMRGLGARISRTKGSFLPRIIHSSHRSIIINNGPGKYFIIKFYLTLFYMYRVIIVPKYTLNLGTIINKGVNMPESFIPSSFYMNFLKLFLRKRWTLLYNPVEFLRSKSRPFSILKSSPNNLRAKNPAGDNVSLWSSHPLVAVRSLFGLVQQSFFDDFIHMASIYSPWIHKFLADFVNSPLSRVVETKIVGKLSFKEEAAGKLRVFAIVDVWTQWLLDPIHRLIFKVLKYIPMDGTFNQLKPIHRLLRLKAKEFYSLDLSAATDRLPLIIQSNLLDTWFTVIPFFGKMWARILVDRVYAYDASKKYDCTKYGQFGEVKYAVGQPMGALSSWAMLALTHHFLVQVSAWKSGFTPLHKLYTNYALLGDDLVVCDKVVAEAYLKLFAQIGVGINLTKSILSPKGIGLEFAKRTFIDGKDVSPISLRDLSLSTAPGNVSQWVAFAKAHNLSFLQQSRILGFGHKAVKSSFRRLNHALKVVFITNIAKIDFNSAVLNLRYKVPINLDKNVALFKAQVLQPILDELDSGFQSNAMDDDPTGRGTNSIWEISLETRFEQLFYTVTYTVRDWIASHASYFNQLFIGTPVASVDGKTYTREELRKLVTSEMKAIQSKLSATEGLMILKKLEAAKNAVKLHTLITLDDCLAAYIMLIQLKAVQSIAVHKLDDRVQIIPSVKLPFQAKLFRSWSRIAVKVAKLANK